MKILLLLLLPISLFAQQQYDVCVYGGTSAGVVAAVTAKRAGKSVVLIEPGQHLGGMSSGGLGATDIGNKSAITGLSRDFYRRIGQHYGKFEQWTFEPGVAENLFNKYIKEANVPVLLGHRITSAAVKNNRIGSITLEPTATGQQKTIAAKQFIDCTYEGDLMDRAGVQFTVGREANSQYGETYNGVQLLDKHQFPDGVDPYVIPGKPESGLIYGVSTAKLAPNGTGDKTVQAYNYRMCLTNDPTNRIPITRPNGYDSTKYELLLRQIARKEPKELTWNLMHFVMMPNRKTDINNCGGLSTDMIGANFDYPTGTYAQRDAIIRGHELYTKGFFYFIGHDPRVPKHLRDEMLNWGYPKDEYTDTGNFSPQLYVREARRMVGEYVMTQANCEGKTTITDGVGTAAYTMDSHNCQRLVVTEPDGTAQVRNEGDVQVGGFPPYPISYRALVPKRGSVQNLLVPVCLSSSHIAFGSIRMEPVFMVLAQSAAVAACQAIDEGKAIQDIDVKKLQTTLAQNPLMNGSRPEVLIDNDDTAQVAQLGTWQRETKSGKYGASSLASTVGKSGSVQFQPAKLQPGHYAVYVYNPARLGGGGNPDSHGDDKRSTDKAASVSVRVYTGSTVTTQTIDQQLKNNDWIRVGDYVFAGKTPWVEITSANTTQPVVADAVLFVPVN
ncbi:MAG: FAD-dependent oxidoreductase [Spirosoma sp.]|nr:FAD-dependent oxidoreductase [Spirosoma sp.]